MFDTRTLITFLGILALGSAINPDNVCALVKDETKIVDDTNCAAYYTCNQGKATAATCPSGLYFNKDNKGCVPKAQATCVDSEVNPCQGVADGQFVAKANSCSGYFYCKSQVGTEGACPGDLVFNPKEQACQYKDQYTCTATGGGSNTIEDNPNLVCVYIPNGIFFGSASNCASWLKCTDNKLESGTCGDGQSFNVQTQSCVWKETYQCQQLNGDPNETGGTPPSSCAPSDPPVKPNPDSCSSYLKCLNGKYAIVKCPSGQYFDEDSKECTNRKDAKNDCDRCEGTTLTFVNAYQDDCRGYLICSNGKQVGSGKCGTGYYFNEVFASCVNATHPGFGVCTLPCTQCTTYDATLQCGELCSCKECPLEPCTQCATYDEKLECGVKCQCAGGALCPCEQCDKYDATLECGVKCKCDTCPALPDCDQCATYDKDLGCGVKCQCADLCPCEQCTTFDEDAPCGIKCKCDTCPAIPDCTQCATYDATLGCGVKCQCADLCPCEQCDEFDADLKCGEECACPEGKKCPCEQCDVYDADCGVECECAEGKQCRCIDCENYDADLKCDDECSCDVCPVDTGL